MFALRQRAAAVAARQALQLRLSGTRSYASGGKDTHNGKLDLEAKDKSHDAHGESSHHHDSSSHGSHDSHGDHHDHHHAPSVPESIGSGFYIALGTVAASIFFYSVSRTGEDGKPSAIHRALEQWADLKDKWEVRNQLTTAAVEQAGRDKNIFINAPRNTHYELRHPEAFQHGSPFNVPAGHYVNMDKVVAHYRKQHLDEEERKAKNLAAAE